MGIVDVDIVGVVDADIMGIVDADIMGIVDADIVVMYQGWGQSLMKKMSHRSTIPGCGVTLEIVSNIPGVRETRVPTPVNSFNFSYLCI